MANASVQARQTASSCSCFCDNCKQLIKAITGCCKIQDEKEQDESAGAGFTGPRRTNSTDSSPEEARLHRAYTTRLSAPADDQIWRTKLFPKLRILVLGKSGSEEGGVPLVIHDSNGIDVYVKERMSVIKDFLERHQKDEDSANHVHIIWYVLQAIDNRSLVDGGLMELIGQFKIPLLLIMTHVDVGKVMVTDASLDRLLEGYGDEEQRAAVKRDMVRVKNEGVTLGPNKELNIDETKRDTEGLKLVSQRTESLIDKRLKYTWIAAQVVDLNAKLGASAGFIAGYARGALLTSFPGGVPFADPIRLSIFFWRIFEAMCQTWIVPENLKETLGDMILMQQGGTCLLTKVGEDLLYAAGLAVTIGATVATSGATLPLIATLVAACVFKIRRSIPIMVRIFSLQLLATILHVKCQQVGSSTHTKWKPNVSKREYENVCGEFVGNPEYQSMLQKYAKDDYTALDTVLSKKNVKNIIKARLQEILHLLLRDRPSSLFSQLKKETKNDKDSSSDMTPSLINGESSHVTETDDEEDEVDELEHVVVDSIMDMLP